MTSDVLDISFSQSPYDAAPQEHDETIRSRSATPASKTLGDVDEVTWKTEEATLSRGTGTVLGKDTDDDDEHRDSTTTEVTEKDDAEKDWHPLQAAGNHTQDTTVVVDLPDSIVDSNGRLLFSDKDSPAPSRRASGMKSGPSPPPWEVIQPPSNNGHRAYGGGAKLISNSPSRRLIPKSSYYFGAPPADSAFGTVPVGHIGIHHPREIIRIERDYTGGELIQFAPIYPLELEGRITPTQFLESINAINECLIEAHSLRMSLLEHVLAVATLYLSRLMVSSHYDKEMRRLKDLFEDLNTGLFNPAGLNVLWPGEVAFLFMEIEYY